MYLVQELYLDHFRPFVLDFIGALNAQIYGLEKPIGKFFTSLYIFYWTNIVMFFMDKIQLKNYILFRLAYE